MEIWDVKNFGDLYIWLQEFDWSGLREYLQGHNLTMSSSWSISWYILIVVLILFGYALSKKIGPPWKRVEPENLYFLAFLGQPLPWYLMNSKVFHGKINGDLALGQGISGWLPHLGVYRFILWPLPWPLAYVKKDNWNGSKPQDPVLIKPYSVTVVAEEAELKGDNGSRARTVTAQFTCWFSNPYDIFFGRAPTNWRVAFENKIKGVMTSVVKGFTEAEIEEQDALQSAIKNKLVSRSGLFGFRRRPADVIAKDVGMRIISADVLNIERPAAYVRAAEIRRNGEERAYVASLFYGKQLDFAASTEKFSDRAVELLKLLNIGSGGSGGPKADLELLAPTSKEAEKDLEDALEEPPRSRKGKKKA